MRYRGVTARAQMIESIDHHIYNARILYLSGPLEGIESLMSHQVPDEQLEEEFIARVELPERGTSRFSHESLTSHHISSTIPSWFDYASSQEIVFYGIHTSDMKGSKGITFHGTRKYFNPGRVYSQVHIVGNNEHATTYQVDPKEQPVQMNKEDGAPRPIGNALRHYVNKMNRWDTRIPELPNSPKLILVDDTIDFATTVEPELQNIEMIYLKMDPRIVNHSYTQSKR